MADCKVSNTDACAVLPSNAATLTMADFSASGSLSEVVVDMPISKK